MWSYYCSVGTESAWGDGRVLEIANVLIGIEVCA